MTVNTQMLTSNASQNQSFSSFSCYSLLILLCLYPRVFLCVFVNVIFQKVVRLCKLKKNIMCAHIETDF
jgi:hypothetical protein